MEPLRPDGNHNPKLLCSWARRAGFRSTASGESFASTTTASDTQIDSAELKNAAVPPPFPKPPGYANRANTVDFEAGPPTANGFSDKLKSTEQIRRPSLSETLPQALTPSPATIPLEKKGLEANKPTGAVEGISEAKSEPLRNQRDLEPELVSLQQDAEEVMVKSSHLKYDIRETPGVFAPVLYAIQHYMSIIGSLILIPLVVMPSIHGTNEDTAKVCRRVLAEGRGGTFIYTTFRGALFSQQIETVSSNNTS